MSTRVARFTYAVGVLTAVCLAFATPARAQFQPRPVDDQPIGEKYIVEAAFGMWAPNTTMSVSSESLGIVGSVIDFKKDLGLQNHRFPEFHLELKGGGHKLRLQAIPIKYEQTVTITRDIIFNGQRYRLGIPVTSSLDWKAYRFGYEFDFIRRNWGYGGAILDFKYTDVTVNLASGNLREYARARAPIPAVGGVARVYVVPNVSITGEVTGFKLPESLVEGSTGHYVDVDIYGTYNVTNKVGVQVGFRSFDLGYAIESDSGSFALRGVFFGVVARY